MPLVIAVSRAIAKIDIFFLFQTALNRLRWRHSVGERRSIFCASKLARKVASGARLAVARLGEGCLRKILQQFCFIPNKFQPDTNLMTKSRGRPATLAMFQSRDISRRNAQKQTLFLYCQLFSASYVFSPQRESSISPLSALNEHIKRPHRHLVAGKGQKR